MCSIIFIISMLVFISGEKYYRIVPPRGEFLPLVSVKLTLSAFRKWLTASKAERKSKSSFLDFSLPEFGAELVTETRLVGNLIALLIPVIFYKYAHLI
jgi:POT family